MTQAEANNLVGRKVENLRPGHRFIVRDILKNHVWLSGGQFIPLDGFEQFWKVVTE